MKLDTKRLINRYIVLSPTGLEKQESTVSSIFGPIDKVETTTDGLIFSTKNNNSIICVDTDEEYNTTDIDFISQYLWRVTLYIHGKNRR